MIKVAILDDYQNVFEQIIDTNLYKDKFEFKIFNEHFLTESEAIVSLEDFEALFIMRERTPLTKNLINSLPKLKYIMRRMKGLSFIILQKKLLLGFR